MRKNIRISNAKWSKKCTLNSWDNYFFKNIIKFYNKVDFKVKGFLTYFYDKKSVKRAQALSFTQSIFSSFSSFLFSTFLLSFLLFSFYLFSPLLLSLIVSSMFFLFCWHSTGFETNNAVQSVAMIFLWFVYISSL